MNPRIKAVPPSLTLAITAKAAALREKGEDVISLSAGEPDFDTPQPVKDAAIKAIRDGHTKYTATAGMASLRRAIAEKLHAENGLQYDHTSVMVSVGAKQCLFNLIFVLCEEGDDVLIPSPYWLSTPEMAKLAGANPVFVPCPEEKGFALTAEAVKKAWTPKTRLIIVNSPNNPTGAVYDDKELTAIGKFCVEKKIFVISDEIYERMVYDGRKHHSILALVPELRSQAAVVSGFSKTWSMTGWRVGYAAGPKEIIDAADRFQGHATANTATPSQHAALAALILDDSFTDGMIREFDKRRRFCVDRIKKIPGVSAAEPHGAFYILIRVDGLYGKSIGGKKVSDSLTFCEILLEKEKLAAVPGVAFGTDKHIRISYATSMGALEKGLNRLEKFVRALQ
ncbi:MAG: pyridoxal phosphate-dependent aminotransferase [Planctomycetes bacterium]|nr:pyridoxal phosphate-dependent aminotransferase [Planctomycetota bacterium]